MGGFLRLTIQQHAVVLPATTIPSAKLHLRDRQRLLAPRRGHKTSVELRLAPQRTGIGDSNQPLLRRTALH